MYPPFKVSNVEMANYPSEMSQQFIFQFLTFMSNACKKNQYIDLFFKNYADQPRKFLHDMSFTA